MNDSTSLSKRQALFVVALMALLLTLPWLDRPFHTRGEPREALVAQSMLVNDNWISPPAYNGAVPSKPPFNHWLISLVSLPQGEVTEFTARFPSAVAIVLFSLALYSFLRRRTTPESALLATLILLSSFEWFRGAVTCRVDTLLSTSLAGALLALFAWREGGRKGFPFLAALLITCAALTKGPIGIALPLAIFALYEFVSEEKRVGNVFRIGLRAAGIAVPVAAIVSLWYIAGYLQRGDAFIDKIYYENFQRLASSMEDEPHKHAAPYMFLMLAIGLLPWTIVWLTAAVRLFSRRNYTRNSLSEMWNRATELQRFSFIAAAFIFIFFCIPSSKRSVYIMPAYPFLAILAAESVRVWASCSQRLMAVMVRILLGFAVVVALLGLCAALIPFRAELAGFPAAMVSSLSVGRVIVLVGLVVCVYQVPRTLWRASAELRLATAMIGALVVSSIGLTEPIFHQLSPREWLRSNDFSSHVNLNAHDRIYSFGSEAYATSFYLNKPFFTATKELPVGSVVVVEQRNLERFKAEITPNVRELARFHSGLEASKKDLVFVEVAAP